MILSSYLVHLRRVEKIGQKYHTCKKKGGTGRWLFSEMGKKRRHQSDPVKSPISYPAFYSFLLEGSGYEIVESHDKPEEDMRSMHRVKRGHAGQENGCDKIAEHPKV